MPNKLQQALTKRVNEIFGTQYCTSCLVQREKKGGKWQVTQNGMNRRWKCAGCYAKQLEREQHKT